MMERQPLAPGLYLVATPIGSARDITLRALDILRDADVIAAEDTRTVRKLMDIHGIPLAGRPIFAYHDHSDARDRGRILEAVGAGRSVAYVSEAGTPLIADPGYALVRDCVAAEAPVTAAPGASALLAALTLAGLPTDRFLFAGFPPVKAGQRARFFEELAGLPATLVFYEAPKRVERSLADMAEAFGPEREAAICRELTKRFEQVLRGPLGDLRGRLGGEMPIKGEFVIVLAPGRERPADAGDLDAALRRAMERMSIRDAAAEVAAAFGIPRKDAYRRALSLKD